MEVGAGRKSRSALFLEANYTSTDVQWHEGIDQLMDVNSIPYRDNSFDLVVCTNVLEHVPTPRRAIGEMHRCLKAGGALFLVVPFLFPVHDIPHDYFRFTEYALLDLLHDWSVVDVRRVYWFGALARYLRLDSFVLYYVVLATK